MKKVSIMKLVFSLALIGIIASALSQSITGTNELTGRFAAVFLAFGFLKGLAGGTISKLKGFSFGYPGVVSNGLTINDTTYAGEVASQFIVKAITGADTIQGGHVMLKDNIKKAFTIPKFSVDSLIQDRVATPTSAGNMTVDKAVLNPADYMVYMEFNPRDFEDHWKAVELNPALLDRSLPVSVESVLIQEVAKFHNNYFDKAIWQGDLAGAAPYNKFDGLVTKGLANASVIDVATPTTLTAGNILAEMADGYTAIPNSLVFDPNIKWFVSYKTAKLYAEAQIAQTYKGVDVSMKAPLNYRGIPVVPIAGFPDDCYLIAKGTARMDSNLWVGINSTEDNNVQIARLQANSELFFIKMLFKADTQIGWGEEVVLYHS